MTDDALRQQARDAGLEPRWRDATGHDREVSVEALRAILAHLPPRPATAPPLVTAEPGQALDLPAAAGPFRLTLEDGTRLDGHTADAPPGLVRIAAPTPPGYHRLELADRSLILAVAPPRCWTVADAAPGRALWGLTLQLYALRREGSALGDFAALADFARHAAAAGAAAIAISPVHAAFSADPHHFSPYAPSSRAQLNAMFADPGPHPAAADALVDWPIAAAARLAALRHAFATAPAIERQHFAGFRAARGAALERHARFEALHAAQLAAVPSCWDWRGWPEPLRRPASPAVAAFAAAHAREVDFHAYVQFRADAGLAAAQQAARDAGMPIGLVADLAVGVDPAGSDAWSEPEQLLHGLGVGAPGDIMSPQGQGWGVTTFSPAGLTAGGYTALLAMLRAALRHAGGVRIDHVMGLARLWVIPDGAGPADGAYLRYPLADILRLVRLESHRHRAIVIGEDLGTLPDGFQQVLQSTGLAGMRVLWFERDAHGFVPPVRWSPDAVAMTTTHDLPTVAGWWTGGDIAWQARIGRGNPAAIAERGRDRGALWSAFLASGAATGEAPAPDDPQPVVDAACAHLGTAACGLALLPIEDALGLVEQPNLPGTIDEHPNWRRRLPGPAADLLAGPRVAARLAALGRARTGAARQ